MYYKKTLSEFLEELGSKNSVPGGGSAAALAGAVAASLVCFISNLTAGKKKYENVEAKVQGILADAKILLKDLEGMVDEDSLILRRLLECYKSNGKKGIDHISREAVSFSTNMAQKCVEVMKLALEVSRVGNRMLSSDFEVAAYIGDAAVNSAVSNVKINLQNIEDEEYTRQTIKTYTKLIKISAVIKSEIIKIAGRKEGEKN